VVSHTRKSFSPDDLELVDQIDVEMQGHHALKITVQERQLIGYVQYLDSDLYFDSEGRIMYSVVREEESADAEEEEVLTAEAVGKTATSYVAAMKEAPLIQGLSFDSVTLHEVLPVEDTSVFNTILGITRMINKYDITPDAVEFDEELNVYLIYGDITVELGQDLLMEEKLARVAAILPSIEGQNGVLHMSDYDGSSDNVVFSKNALSAEGLDEETTKSEEISHEYALVKGEKDAAEEEPSQTETTTPAKQTTEPAVDTEEQTGDADTAAEETEGDIQIDRPVLENLS
jgi:cell division protein FtsQ